MVDTVLLVGDRPTNFPGSALAAAVGMAGTGLSAAVGGPVVEVVHTIVFALFPCPVRRSRSLHCLP